MANDPGPHKHIRLTSHPGQQGISGAPAIRWGAATAAERGPVVGTTTNRAQRNVIGTHSGSYGVYRALAGAAGNLVKGHRADLTDTAPTQPFGPHPSWGDAEKMVSIDPWGASVAAVFAEHIAQGYDIRPTIADPFASRTLSSAASRPAAIAVRTSGRSMCALVTAIVGRMS